MTTSNLWGLQSMLIKYFICMLIKTHFKMSETIRNYYRPNRQTKSNDVRSDWPRIWRARSKKSLSLMVYLSSCLSLSLSLSLTLYLCVSVSACLGLSLSLSLRLYLFSGWQRSNFLAQCLYREPISHHLLQWRLLRIHRLLFPKPR